MIEGGISVAYRKKSGLVPSVLALFYCPHDARLRLPGG
jgi:hypothetical protein